MVKGTESEVIQANESAFEEIEYTSNGTQNHKEAIFDPAPRFPITKTLPELFETEAKRSRNHTAIICGETMLTYQELNTRSNQLAHRLRSLIDIAPDTLIGLILEKNECMIISILGAWKAGAAVVPIDPGYPDERIRFMINEIRAKVIITNQHLVDRLKNEVLVDHHPVIIKIESIPESMPIDNPQREISCQDIAYVTYTSGTTGMPKGVVKEHKNVVNAIIDLASEYEIREKSERIALFSSYVFEPFMRQMLMALLHSHTLVIVNDEVKTNPPAFAWFLNDHAITYLNGTASVLQEYDYSDCPELRRLLFAGEELMQSCYNKIRKSFKGTIINEYGPTESALVTTFKEYGPMESRLDRSVGTPIAHSRCYILNDWLQKVETGETGELFIGGIGVSPGYLNRPDLTSDRFLPNPFQTDKERLEGWNDRIYKTGDLARWLPNGELEYLGRSDNQVKINGIRVELGEIEAILGSYLGIRQCVVIAKQARNGDGSVITKYLVGYFVSEPYLDVIEEEMLDYLRLKLPSYMIPIRLLKIDKIPVTINGKVDKNALPDLDDFLTAHSELNQKTDMESELCQIWSDILDIPASKIGISDEFLRLGGDSIKAIQLIGQLRKKFSVTISISDIFSMKTLARLSGYVSKAPKEEIQESTESEISNVNLPTCATDVEAMYLASGLQQGFMYHYLKQSDIDDAYIVQTVYQYGTILDVDLMQKAWTVAQQTHPALRTRFLAAEEDAFQIVDRSQTVDWRFLDLIDLDEPEQQKEIDQLQKQDRLQKYHLENGNLYRVYLIKQKLDLFTLLFSCHHIILDGWSIPILIDFVHETYLKLVQADHVTIVPDQAFGLAQAYIQAHRDDHIDYWTDQVNQIAERCDLNGLIRQKLKYKVVLSEYDHIKEQREKSLLINGDLYRKVKGLCVDANITLHSVLQFVWHKLLCAYGGSSQTVVGTLVSGRNLPIDNIESSVGLFINTLPLIIDHDKQRQKLVIEAIEALQCQVSEMSSRSHVELARIQKGEAKHGLFDSLFVLENYANLNQAKSDANKKILRFETKYSVEKLDYPLAIMAYENGESIKLNFLYAGELFEECVIDQVLAHYHHLIGQITNDSQQKVSDLDLLTPMEKKIINQWNSTETKFPSDQTLHQIFEVMAEKYPDKTAVVYEDRRLTYRQLNERSNRLAHHLRSISDISPDTLIAIIQDKSELMIVSILGIWKSGAAYVPIDPSYPDDRIGFILGDTKAKVIITNQKYFEKVERFSDQLTVLGIEEASLWPYSEWESRNMVSISKSTDLAYVIYTSGTTGNPKGVMVEHIGVVNLQVSLSKIFGLQQQDEVILSFSNFVFDHFVEQMIDALLNGQTLAVLNDEMRVDKRRLYDYMTKNKVTYLSGTPSVLQMYDYDQFDHRLTRIDAVGEDFSEATFNKIRSTFQGLIINGYGPTEVSITSHKKRYPCGEKRTNKSIGTQVANTICYVLDGNMKQVPIGGIGELYLGGIGVARGYLNRPDLTEDRFRPDPYRRGETDRIYKTGDLVRWLPNGEIEYLGRNDFQVKIRGLRIELGEIESILASYAGVKQAVVVAKDHQDTNGAKRKCLIGYFVSSNTIFEHDLKKSMKNRLPEYMVPNRLIRIEKIPVTISGKLDSKALPDPELTNDGSDSAAPKNDLQLKLCHIWSDLLGVPANSIGIHNDFFSLGGDSLMAQRLFFKLSNLFTQNFSVATIFQNKTIEAMSNYILAKNDSNPMIERTPDQDVAASFGQERLLFINDYDCGGCAYNVTVCLKMSPEVDLGILKEALISVIDRHESLRTVFVQRKSTGDYVQRVLDEDGARSMFVVDQATVHGKLELDQNLIKASKHVFRLDSELPIRTPIFQNSEDNHFYVAIVVHHACFDGWSWVIFRKELRTFYEFLYDKSCGIEKLLDLPTLEIQYKDFSCWQRKTLNKSKLKHLADFWTMKLEGFEPLNLVPDFPRPAHFDYAGMDLHFELDKDTTEQLKALAMDLKVSVFSTLVSAFCFILSSFTNQKDIVIGTPVANRNRSELEHMIGFFVNMLALRVKIEPQHAFGEYIQMVSDEVIKAQIHQEMPFEQLVKEMKAPKDLSRHPVVQVVFSWNPFEAALDTGALECNQSELEMASYSPDDSKQRVAKYDMSTTMSESENGMKGCLNFCTKLFAEETMQSFMESFIHVLKQFATAGKIDKKLSTIECTDNGRLISPSLSISAYQPKTLHQVFEEEVDRSPEKSAIVYHDVMMTYQELNDRANRLAHYLRSLRSIEPDQLIALILDKSDLMIISILGAWKAGTAYVPIDPSYPNERIGFILKDTHAKLIITNRQYASKLRTITSNQISIIEIDDDHTIRQLRDQPISNMDSKATPDNLAYVIYTSGTTGQPKGVMVEHRSVVNLRNDLIDRYFDQKIDTDQQAILFLSNYVFDFSVEQLILSILGSNKLIITDQNQIFDDRFYRYVNAHGLSYLSGTPTYLEQIDLSKLKHLQTVTVAGEPFTKTHFDKIRSKFGGTLINAYGITETTVYNMICRYKNGDQYCNSLGQPLSDTKPYVLSESMQVLPQGAVGELYLAGECVTRGYLNRSDLTDQRFLANPFQTEEEKKMGRFSRIYKSGDLVRYNHKGELEYLGRNDQQVKIRGLRIELHEIETVLASYPGIRQCAVVATNRGQDPAAPMDLLIGYYVSHDGEDLDEEAIKMHMQAKLPAYMVPARLVRVDQKLPTTINGKLDTRALPKVDFAVNKLSFSKPRNAFEERLCQIWAASIGVSEIGIDDDFFQLGGDSIVSLQVCAKIRHELNVMVSVKDIFVHRTIRALSGKAFSKCQTPKMDVGVEQGTLTGPVPLLPIQQWFFDKNLRNQNHWNQSFAIRTPALDLGKLKEALEKLIEHHDAFRLRFKRQDDGYIQFYDQHPEEIDLKIFDVQTDQNLEESMSRWQQSLNIETGPLFCIAYTHGYADGSARVWFAMHHLIVDTVSWRIICQDLQATYHGGQLGPKGSSYRQWTKAMQEYPKRVPKEEEFWKELAFKADAFNESLETHSQANSTVHGSFSLTLEETDELLRTCSQAYGSQTIDLLLTGLAYALKDLTSEKRSYVTIEGHGREDISVNLDISRTVGWFTTMYPIELTIGPNLQSSIQSVRDYTNRVIPNKGIGYGPTIGYGKSLPRVSFNYLGQFDTDHEGYWNLIDITGDYTQDRSIDSQGADHDLISVTGLCAGGQMRFNIDTRISEESSEKFISAFKSKLQEIIGHRPEILDDFEPYVEFCQGPKAPILFMLPPGEGGAESYFNNLVRYLPRFRLILFNNYYLHSKKASTTYEDLARFYTPYIKKLQPQGPYNFLGWSFGGVLSLEISRQLAEEGENIDSLILIDSYFDAIKATSDIGRSGKYILDKINYMYAQSQKAENFKILASGAKNVVLFQAAKLNRMYQNEDEKALYEYYMKTSYNTLDSVIPSWSIQRMVMEDDDHTSWVYNEKQLQVMASVINRCSGMSGE